MHTFLYAPDDGSGAGGGDAGAGAGGNAGTQQAGGAATPPGNATGNGSGGSTLLSGSSGGSQSAGGTPPSAGTPPPAGSVVQKSWREGWIGNDGKINKSKYDELPDNLKIWKDTFSKYDTDEQLLGAFAHSIALNGKKGLMPLPENASPQMREEYNARLREILKVPKDVEGYGIKKPDNIPDTQWNGEYVNKALGIMHKYNAPPEMVRELVAADQEFAKGMRSQTDASTVREIEAAKSEIATAFGTEADQKISQARRYAATLGLDANDPRIGNNAKLIIALAKGASMIGEDKLVNVGGGGASSGVNDREKAKDIIHNKSNPLHEAYHNPSHGQHAQAVAQVVAFNSAAVKAAKAAGSTV